MTEQRPPGRRRFLRASAGIVLATPLAGCLGPNGSSARDGSTDNSPSGTETLGERPLPSALVGDESYADAFADRVERNRFPEPNADLIPELTKARFVAATATDEGESAFAERIDGYRDPLFEPLRRFDAVVVLSSDRRRERLSDEQREELLAEAGLEDEDVSWDEDTETVVDATLDDRETTFFDYPGPPLHVIESAESTGRDRLDRGPDERAETVEEPHRPYVRQRGRIEAIVAGARELATDAYETSIERIRESSPSDREYERPESYAEVVAFNAALAAESMLEMDGEIVTAP